MKKVNKFKNAEAAIKQIKAGEWEFIYNDRHKGHIQAIRGEHVLWVGNGGFFLDVNDSNAFGFVLRHWVWWAAARCATKTANKKVRLDNTVKLYT